MISRPMKYKKIVDGLFIDRPNRFIAHVDIQGVTETVHVKNTGRCKELLIPGCPVRLELSDNPNRKTRYDLVAVCKKDFGLRPNPAGIYLRRVPPGFLHGKG